MVGGSEVVLVSAGAVVLARVMVVMSSEQADVKSAAKAKDSPREEKKLNLRRTMMILGIKPVHYKAYFLNSQNWKRGPPGARTQHLEVKSLLLYLMS